MLWWWAEKSTFYVPNQRNVIAQQNLQLMLQRKHFINWSIHWSFDTHQRWLLAINERNCMAWLKKVTKTNRMKWNQKFSCKVISWQVWFSHFLQSSHLKNWFVHTDRKNSGQSRWLCLLCFRLLFLRIHCDVLKQSHIFLEPFLTSFSQRWSNRKWERATNHLL